MPAQASPSSSKLRSVFAKITFLAAICGLGFALALTALSVRAGLEQVRRAVSEVAEIAVPTIAAEAVVPMTYAHFPKVEAQFTHLADVSGGKNIGALAINAQGNVKAKRLDGADEATLITLAQRALTEGQLVSSADGLYQAAPARPANGTPPVGAVATAWTTKVGEAKLWADLRLQAAGMAAIFGALLLMMGWAANRMITRPLTQVNAAVEKVAQGDYTVRVPHLARRDEIGVVARSLEAFRKSLADGAEARHLALLRGAALEASSSAFMITDESFLITAVNPAMVALFQRLAPLIRRDNPGFDPEALIGTSALGILVDKSHRSEENHLAEGGRWRIEHELAESALRIEVAPVCDAAGTRIAHVAQWSDITERRHNAAILGTIDRSQMRAEFSLDGRLITANTRFTALPGAEIGADLRTALALYEGDGSELLSRVATGEEIVGRFDLRLGTETRVIDGALAAVVNGQGRVVKCLLLGSDVTRAVETLNAAAAARAADQARQQQVVDALRDSLSHLSEGDLTNTITTPFPEAYETLRHDYNAATAKLREAMQTVLENSDSIRAETGGISRAAVDLSHRTEQQAATLEQTAAALNQLTTSVKSAADRTGFANELVGNARRSAETSGKVVHEAVQAMGEIADSSNKISKITSVIEEISFQTNLLALNAGVEAARAGEAGRGFAVVASEVRALAQRSSEAAREIAGLISASSSQVKRGVDLVGQAGNVLGGIRNSVDEIVSFMSEMAAATTQQSVGLSEVNTAVMQLDQVTQQNAAMFEQTSAASQSLVREADGLNATMARFRLDLPEAGSASAFRSTRAHAAPERPSTEPAAPAQRPAAPRTTPPAPLSRPGHRLSSLAVKHAPDEEDWEDF